MNFDINILFLIIFFLWPILTLLVCIPITPLFKYRNFLLSTVLPTGYLVLMILTVVVNKGEKVLLRVSNNITEFNHSLEINYLNSFFLVTNALVVLLLLNRTSVISFKNSSIKDSLKSSKVTFYLLLINIITQIYSYQLLVNNLILFFLVGEILQITLFILIGRIINLEEEVVLKKELHSARNQVNILWALSSMLFFCALLCLRMSVNKYYGQELSDFSNTTILSLKIPIVELISWPGIFLVLLILALIIKIGIFPFTQFKRLFYAKEKWWTSPINTLLAVPFLSIWMYGLINFALPFLAQDTTRVNKYFEYICLVGMIYSLLMLLRKNNSLSNIIVYFINGQLFFILLGFFNLGRISLQGVLLKLIFFFIINGWLIYEMNSKSIYFKYSGHLNLESNLTSLKNNKYQNLNPLSTLLVILFSVGILLGAPLIGDIFILYGITSNQFILGIVTIFLVTMFAVPITIFIYDYLIRAKHFSSLQVENTSYYSESYGVSPECHQIASRGDKLLATSFFTSFINILLLMFIVFSVLKLPWFIVATNKYLYSLSF